MSGPRPTSLREFELVVLLAVLGLGEDAYPVSIRDAIAARTKRRVSRAAVFITLERLEDKGIVSSRFGDPTPVRGGRAKRFFRATPAGIAAARQSLSDVESMAAGLEAILKKS
jgi:PadR family transcriptional regulator, regulatory protein PadR